VLTLDRDAAIATWRRAEARIYPSVMVSAPLYEQYLRMVRAVIDELGDVQSEDDLFLAWQEHRHIAREVVVRLAPTFGSLMDTDSVRDAAFCTRHREITREQGKRIAAERLEQARRNQDEWALLFDDVTPMGSHRLEMHVRTGNGIHASSTLSLDGSQPTFEVEVVSLDPTNGAWILDKPPLVPSQRYDTYEEWQARIAQARSAFGKDTR
jgi:hypothetical protein